MVRLSNQNNKAMSLTTTTKTNPSQAISSTLQPIHEEQRRRVQQTRQGLHTTTASISVKEKTVDKDNTKWVKQCQDICSASMHSAGSNIKIANIFIFIVYLIYIYFPSKKKMQVDNIQSELN